MKINEDILDKLNKPLNDIELENEIIKLSNSDAEKEELREIYSKLRNLEYNNFKLSENYKNSALLKVNNKIDTQKVIHKLNRVSFAMYCSLILLFSFLTYNTLFENKPDENMIIFNKNDIEFFTNINTEEVKNTLLYTDYIEPLKEKSSSNNNSKVEEMDEEVLAIAETNKYLLSQSYIPAVDDILLYECVDEEILKNIIKNL